MTPQPPRRKRASAVFVHGILQKLGAQMQRRKARDVSDHSKLEEARVAYNTLFVPQNGLLSAENGFCWNELFEKSVG